MASTINNAFITQFEAEVHMAYQRMGSKLKNLVRTVNNVNGSSVKFQKVAKGTANTKARHAEVVAMDLAHSNVSATLTDYYAADYVDKLDELKVNIDERQVIAQSAAYALGRKTDEVANKLNKKIKEVDKWAKNLKLTFSTEKTKIIPITRKRIDTTKIRIKLRGKKLEIKKSHPYLGVIKDGK